MYSSIKLKKKICKGCNRERYIWARGLCKECSNKANSKPIQRSKSKSKVIYHSRNKIILSQTEAFMKAFKYWNGRNFLTGEKENWEELEYSNFHHALPKGRYKYFKYYPKCIVIIPFEAHFVITHGTVEDQLKHMESHPEEDWKKIDDLAFVLKAEYEDWLKYHKGEYKLNEKTGT